ncbi:hypothetical protein V8D89_011921 [Ganoderma adspersum]
MGKTKQRLAAIGDRVFKCRRRKKKDSDVTPYFNLFPVSVLERIFMFACMDSGFTGASLSCVSKSVRHLSSTTRFHSVALCSGSAAQIKAFLALFTTQRRFAVHKPTVTHLYVYSPFSKDLPGAPDALAKEEARFMRHISSLMRLVAPHLETLCFVQCADTPNAMDFIRPVSPPPTDDDKLIFPNLRELMFVGSGIVHRGTSVPADDLACQRDAPEVFPRLTHLQLVATVMELASWPALAPNLTHMRVTDHDQYGARQVIRSTLMHASRRVLGRPLDLPRAYAPETVYMLMGVDGGPVRVLRCYEPRVVRAESDWEEVMKREWRERIGGGLGCWAAVERGV